MCLFISGWIGVFIYILVDRCVYLYLGGYEQIRIFQVNVALTRREQWSIL